ncbi:DUF6773 family protein [Alkalicoccus daliensis]|uniref:DUF3278 domain-containing protein n=1 Tax=Alkalicoccus daliensis TaxID=745820 RepID=A0A1H0EYT4_9BACI|nr:DUF6773 family protein [Alkalicoccus daliensis]SDN87449.1 hypothetical protein SAMN04488053_104121 [Alkalicoccus daliensis]
MFGRKGSKDERLEMLENKVYKEMMYLVYTVLTLSIIYKYIRYGIGPGEASAVLEISLLLLLSLYSIVRYKKLQLFVDKAEEYNARHKMKYSTFNMVIGGVIGLGLALLFGINSAVNYADTTAQSIYYFFLVFGVSAVIYMVPLALLSGIVPWLAERKAEKLRLEGESED